MSTLATTSSDALRIVEDVCHDFDGNGNGIFSVGAIAALRAMAYHWENHLADGHSPTIISEDIVEMVQQMHFMRAEIMRRLLELQNLDEQRAQPIGAEASVMRCRLEVTNDAFGNSVFWEGNESEVDAIEHLPGRMVAREVFATGKPAALGKWRGFPVFA